MAEPKIKLLLVTDEMEVGGTQRQLVNLLTHIDRLRFEPALLYFRNSSHLVGELEQAGIPVYHIPKKGKIDPGLLPRILRLYRDLSIDQIHCFSLTAELWGGLAQLMHSGSIYHTSIRGTHQWYSSGEWLVKRLVTHWSSSVVANSQAGSDHTASKVTGTAKKLKIIYNGIEKKNQELLAIDKDPIGSGETIGLFVGRLVDVKNLPCIIRALERLRDRGYALTFLFAGSGPEERTIRELVAQRQLQDYVVLLGERDDAQALMQHARFIVLPSHNEGLSNSVLEGMINSRLVIASNVPGNAEAITDGQTGALFQPDNDEELAELMIRAIDDPDWAAEMGEAAKADAEARFSMDAMVNGFMNHYLSYQHTAGTD